MRPVSPITDLRTHPKAYVSAAQLALYLDVPRRTIYRHIEKGALRVVHIGDIIRIPIRAAREYAGIREPIQKPTNTPVKNQTHLRHQSGHL